MTAEQKTITEAEQAISFAKTCLRHAQHYRLRGHKASAASNLNMATYWRKAAALHMKSI